MGEGVKPGPMAAPFPAFHLRGTLAAPSLAFLRHVGSLRTPGQGPGLLPPEWPIRQAESDTTVDPSTGGLGPCSTSRACPDSDAEVNQNKKKTDGCAISRDNLQPHLWHGPSSPDSPSLLASDPADSHEARPVG